MDNLTNQLHNINIMHVSMHDVCMCVHVCVCVCVSGWENDSNGELRNCLTACVVIL